MAALCPIAGLVRHPPELTRFGPLSLVTRLLIAALQAKQTEVAMSVAVVDQLVQCLKILDSLGEKVAACHVDAAIHALIDHAEPSGRLEAE